MSTTTETTILLGFCVWLTLITSYIRKRKLFICWDVHVGKHRQVVQSVIGSFLSNSIYQEVWITGMIYEPIHQLVTIAYESSLKTDLVTPP